MADKEQPYRFFIIDHRQQALVAQIVDSQLQGETVAEFLKLELMKIIDAMYKSAETNEPQEV